MLIYSLEALFSYGKLYYDITSLSLSTHKKIFISSASKDFIKIKHYIKDLIASDVLPV
jgi:hypothetical protein